MMSSEARAWRKVALARPVVVNLKDGGAIRALALRPLAGGRLLELRKPTVIPAGTSPANGAAADGVIVVPLGNVDFVQVL